MFVDDGLHTAEDPEKTLEFGTGIMHNEIRAVQRAQEGRMRKA